MGDIRRPRRELDCASRLRSGLIETLAPRVQEAHAGMGVRIVRVELERPIDLRLRLLQRRLATVPSAEAGVEKAHEADQRVERG
jgi:hypothetical protein